MSRHTGLIQLLVWVSILCLGSIAFIGCSDSGANPPPPGPPVVINANVPAPATPTPEDIANAAVVPPIPVAMVMPMEFVLGGITRVAGRNLATATHTGTWLETSGSPVFDVDYGADGSVEGSVNIITTPVGIATEKAFGLPDGVSSLTLSGGSIIVHLPAPVGSGTDPKVALTQWTIKTTAHAGPVWTLPRSFGLNIQTQNGLALANGSQISLTWNPAFGSFPPVDAASAQSMLLYGQFFNGLTKVVDTAKVLPVSSNTASYTAVNPKKFDELRLMLDLSDGHPATP